MRIAAYFASASVLLLACSSERTGFDAPPEETPISVGTTETIPDAGTFETCAGSAVEALREKRPVDILWIVDNSASMQPAVTEVQAGLNTFASLVDGKGLDYKVIMLSLRGTAPITSGGSTRYPVCIPPPLGGADCGDGPLFFHAPLDVQSTQPLEQLLGTLDQTQGYTAGNARGSIPWAQELRPNATKSIVLVTDDNSRFPATSFETFPGGDNPNTGGLVLPVGLLDASRANAWAGYSFSAIYGWGAADPSIRCTYPGGEKPAASGSEYTTLVAKTKGARAQICDGSAAWGPFFDAVASAVLASSRIACDLAIPKPQSGVIDPSLVNVQIDNGVSGPVSVPRVSAPTACGADPGWYYDDPIAPTKVVLCPTSCEAAQTVDASKLGRIDVVFGCASLVR